MKNIHKDKKSVFTTFHNHGRAEEASSNLLIPCTHFQKVLQIGVMKKNIFGFICFAQEDARDILNWVPKPIKHIRVTDLKAFLTVSELC